MDWSAWEWLFGDPSSVAPFFAQQVAAGLAIGAAALVVTLVYRRR